MNNSIDQALLFQMARDAMRQAHAPYSGITVGAAIYTKSNNIHSGCNVENASLGLTNCAERSAVFNGILVEGSPRTNPDGEIESNGLEIIAFAVIAEKDGKAIPISPCGACRQVLWEFSNSSTLGFFLNKDMKPICVEMGTLLPFPFPAKNWIAK